MKPDNAPCVYFPVETTGREFAGHVLLGTRLASIGVTVVIGHKDTVARLVREAPGGGIVFYKGDARLSLFQRPDFLYVGQDPETGISWENFDTFMKHRPLVFGRINSSSAYFAYGNRDYSTLQQRFPEVALKVHATGSARTMLWGAPGDEFYSPEVEQIRERYDPFCLFVSGSGRGDRFDYSQHADRRGQTERAATTLLQKALAVRQATGLSVVIRPHPSESWLQWKRDVRQLAGIHVETCFDLGSWIRAAQFVVQAPKSTAAFEAWMAGTPSIASEANELNVRKDGSRVSLDAYKLCVPHSVWDRPFDHAYVLSEYESLRQSPEANTLVAERIFPPTQDATTGIAQVICRLAEDASKFWPRPSTSLVVGERLRLHSARRAVHQERLGRRIPPPYKRWALSKARVQGATERSAHILGIRAKIETKLILPNCFVLKAGD